MTAVPVRKTPAPQVPPVAGQRERHLRIVPPPAPPEDDESRRLRETRWLSALVALATLALIGLWTAALLGAADEAWWPSVFGAVFAGVVAFGVVVLRRTR